jgi:hypothetical protein
MGDTFVKNIRIDSLCGENITALWRYCSRKTGARLTTQNESFSRPGQASRGQIGIKPLGGRNLMLDTYIPSMSFVFLICSLQG